MDAKAQMQLAAHLSRSPGASCLPTKARGARLGRCQACGSKRYCLVEMWSQQTRKILAV